MQLAAQVDCHWSLIAAIENGEISPRLRTVLRLARAVGVDPARLVSWLPSRTAERSPVDVRDPRLARFVVPTRTGRPRRWCLGLRTGFVAPTRHDERPPPPAETATGRR